MTATGSGPIGAAALLYCARRVSSSLNVRPRSGAYAQNRKEVAADLRGDDDLGIRVAAERAAGAVEACDPVEPRRPAAPVVDVATGRSGALDAQLRIGVEDADQLFGVFVRQRPEQDAADQREQNRTHADADAHRRHRQQRDAGRAAQHADRVEGFPPQLFELEAAARFSELLARVVDTPELAARVPSRVLLVESLAPLFVDERVEVVRQLLGGLAIEATCPHELQHATPECPHHWLFSTRSMAAAVRSHAFCCTVRRRRPAAVSV